MSRSLRAGWRALSFDLDGTLYDYERCHREALRAAAREARWRWGLSLAEFLSLYEESRAIVHGRLLDTAASHSRLLYFHELAGHQAGRFSLREARRLERAYWSGFYEAMRVFRGVPEVLRRLRRRAVRLALTTDMVTATQYEKLARLGLAKAFDVVVTSEESGRDKPDPAIFHLCTRRLGVEAKDVIHIGDDYDRDVEGARKVGMQALWFAPRAEPGKVKPVRSFAELERVLCPRA